MKLKPNIAISDSGFIFDPSSGNSFTANPIGLQIIKHLLALKSVSEIKALLLNEYESSREIINRDVDDFINVLKKIKLLEA